MLHDYTAFFKLAFCLLLALRVPCVLVYASSMIDSVSSSSMDLRCCFIRSYFSQGLATSWARLTLRFGSSRSWMPFKSYLSHLSSHGLGLSFTWDTSQWGSNTCLLVRSINPIQITSVSISQVIQCGSGQLPADQVHQT